MRHAWRVLTDAVKGWKKHKAGRLAAALAFYTVFSLAPLLLLVVALVGIFFGRSEAQAQVHTQLQSVMGPSGATFVDNLVAGTARRESGSQIALIVGGSLVFLSAIGLFLALQDALDEVWEIPPERKAGFFGIIVLRLHALLVVLALAAVAIGALIAVNVFADIVRASIGGDTGRIIQFASIAVNVAALTLFLTVTYRVLPQEEVAWKSAVTGAVISAAILVLGEAALSIYFRRVHPGAVYGAAGALVLILLWIYYSAQLLLFGAELTRAIEGGRIPTEPERGAVHGEVQATQNETVRTS
jgi:membrane protein